MEMTTTFAGGKRVNAELSGRIITAGPTRFAITARMP